LGVPLLLREEFEVIIMIAVVDRRDAWVGSSFLIRNDYKRAYGWKSKTFHESEMALSSECMHRCGKKGIDRACVVREAILCQL
jgi:hypothetical protein